MMAFGGPGLMELLMVVLLGGGLNLPVGLPPEAEDPKMSQVAPEQALVYLSWAGTATADPNSGNGTERLLAEPQVKFMLRKIEEGILGALNREARNDEEAKALIKHGHLLIKQTLLRPATIYLSKLDPFAETPAVEAGLVVNFGKEAAAAKKALEAFESILVKELGADVTIMPVNEGGLRRLPLPEEMPLIAWGFEGDYLMIAVGKETAGRLRTALNTGKAPAWLTDVKKRLALPRHSSLSYVNVAALLKQFGPMLASEMLGGPDAGRQFDRTMAALGIDKMQYFAAVTGFDDAKFVNRSFVAAAADARGLFDLIPKAGLTPADLADVPRDADLAFLLKANPASVFDQIIELIGAIEPRAKEEIMRDMKEAEEELGFRFKEDLFASIGDVFSIYNSPGEGGLLITGLTGVAQVKDAAKAKKVIEQLEKLFDAEWNRPGRVDPEQLRWRRFEIKTLELGDQKIRYINPVGQEWVVSPAWCLTKDRFIIAPYPQMVRSYLERTARPQAGTLADVPQVKELFAKGNTPAVITYLDTPELFKKAYPLAYGLASLALGELQRDGFDMDITALPTASAILPHLSPDTATMSRVSDGVLSESRTSLPMAGAASGLPVLGMASWMEARSVHRFDEFAEPGIGIDEPAPVAPPPARPALRTTAARRAVASSDLHQIAIAYISYLIDNARKPPASLKDLEPYHGGKIGNDPWGQPYSFFGSKAIDPKLGKFEVPLAATIHTIDGKRVVAYADGHVAIVEEAQFKKQMEAAKLPYALPVDLKQEGGDVKEKGSSKSIDKDRAPVRTTTTNEKE